MPRRKSNASRNSFSVGDRFTSLWLRSGPVLQTALIDVAGVGWINVSVALPLTGKTTSEAQIAWQIGQQKGAWVFSSDDLEGLSTALAHHFLFLAHHLLVVGGEIQ